MDRHRLRHHSVCILFAIVCVAPWGERSAAQQPTKQERNPRFSHLALITRPSPDSVVLRWASSKPGGWSIANDLGYVVERIRLNADGTFDPGGFERLTPLPLKPWALVEWKRRSTSDNHFAAIAAQALYGKSFLPKSVEHGELTALRNAADELSNRHSFALLCADNSPLAATGLALRFVDNNVHDGEKYVYRVFVGGADRTYSFDTAFAVVRIESQDLPPRVQLSAEGLDGRIVLRWKEFVAHTYSGYYVYRSDDGGKSYLKMNNTPLVAAVPEEFTGRPEPRYTDTAIVNYRKYHYQVRGVTPFAELGPPADMEVWGRDRTPPPPPRVGKPIQRGRTKIELQWEVTKPGGDLHGFVVARSASSLGGFHELMKTPLPSQSRTFLDTNATGTEPYYIVGAVDTAGNVALSLPVFGTIVDSLPPAAPTGLLGTIDSNGVVRLRWRLGREHDIIGYRVFRSNDAAHEFAQLTPAPIKDTTYIDSITKNTLSSAVYYRVVAVDNRYNHSDFSSILVLHRRDWIPPEAPVFKDVAVSDTSVHLIWIPSPSKDVKSQLLYRRRQGEKQWLTLASTLPAAWEYVDRAVVPRITYEYMLVAIDSSGLRSVPAMPIQARPYDTGVRASVDTVRARYDPQKKSVFLSWKYASPPKEKFHFALYRAANRGNLTLFRAVDGAAQSCTDTAILPNVSYRYAVRVITSVGGESLLSPVTQVNVK